MHIYAQALHTHTQTLPAPHTNTRAHTNTHNHTPNYTWTHRPTYTHPHKPYAYTHTQNLFVCGCVSMGPWFCVWVCGCWCEVWDGFVCVCGPVAPTSSHTPTHRRTPARRNKQEVTHPPTCKPNHTTIHKPTQTHTPHTKAHPHTCAHVACRQGACRGVWGGGTPGVRTNEGVHKGEIGMNSREFT